MEKLPVLSGDLFEVTNYEDNVNLDSADAQRISNTDETNWIEYLNSIRNSQSILELDKTDCVFSDQENDNTPNARGVYQSQLATCKFEPPFVTELKDHISRDVEDEVLEIISISSEEIQEEDDDIWPEFPEGFMETMDAIEEMIDIGVI
ncbi:hypothetical protein RN001_008586 [Aquatica leii]|uniref:Uncharacterized protein n=1 Tax=Aquatica leii TaxID=1421715 RepID=A0AAN7SRE6_9COLE|nr:hypothetical protein RN001_008586 [Aquatica leii]